MNTAEDIKRMLGELVDEAIRIGGAEGEKTLGTEAQLKEQVKWLINDKRNLTQNLDHVIEENNDLGLIIGRLRATLEKAEDENETLRAKVAGYDGVSREQAKKVNQLTERVRQLETIIKEQADALAIYRVPTPRDCPFCGGPAEVHQLHKDEWYVACGNGDCPVNPETNTFDTEADAIEAWNNSYNAPKVTCDWR